MLEYISHTYVVVKAEQLYGGVQRHGGDTTRIREMHHCWPGGTDMTLNNACSHAGHLAALLHTICGAFTPRILTDDVLQQACVLLNVTL